jgi:hypothetical protein
MSPNQVPIPEAEQLFTMKDAAATLGLHYWWLQQAVLREDIPHYTPFNSKKLVKLSDIMAFIERAKKGGAR